MATTMRLKAKGIKIRCAGRLGGAEMARVETFKEGRIPLHTLRAILIIMRLRLLQYMDVLG